LARSSPALANRPDKVKWGPAPPALPKGVEMAVLDGDPKKEGAPKGISTSPCAKGETII
jgi:hypothetical protein